MREWRGCSFFLLDSDKELPRSVWQLSRNALKPETPGISLCTSSPVVPNISSHVYPTFPSLCTQISFPVVPNVSFPVYSEYPPLCAQPFLPCVPSIFLLWLRGLGGGLRTYLRHTDGTQETLAHTYTHAPFSCTASLLS